ncbi:hypothetical protein Belba_0128 [Belliella baltica DSM 15883]|uniref:BioF2-like acetyltransferase domain-containing protein n=1 Tax=Belliella baltica (strain DSM 15883 / CIP 108006 / LMG 21964 / BA134) TaxID=866536 RepID=I3Z0N1_BELBD|nr:hypothetical protein [Belliella baltica]AFL82799.1 hypothetical protein Belba_0128 [Belliella baltica DSM 15883]
MHFKKEIDDQVSLTLDTFEQSSHDYFLQNFVPVDAVHYLHGKVIKKGVIKGEIFISINVDSQAESLPKSPFGGFWIDETINSDIISDFIRFLIENLKDLGVKSFKVTQAPCVYGKKSDLIGYLLFSQGFVLSKVLNHQVLAGKKSIKSTFNQLYSKYHKKAKEQKYNITTGNIQSFNFLQDIASWKNTRGHEILMEEDKLIQQVSNFPERYFVITILHEGEAVAHAIAVKLTSDSLYYFYSAINPKNQLRLTGELLMVYLLKLAMEKKVSFLDLGSSDLDGKPNHKLMYFKNKFADNWSNKSTWFKEIES